MARTYIGDLRGVHQALAESQQQVTTGRSMIRPSDDPVGIAVSLACAATGRPPRRGRATSRTR